MSCSPRNKRVSVRCGFTMLEMLLAVAILAGVSVVIYAAFSVVTSSWQRMTKLSDDIHHADFVMDQLVMALRSAYYPEPKNHPEYGFTHESKGSEPYSEDKISWVKLGNSLVGKECKFAGTPHRVEVSIEGEGPGRGVAVKAWRLQGQPEDFDPEKLDPYIISTRVAGLKIRTAYRKKENEIDWLDEWEQTNRIPQAVEITLYLAPLKEGGEPVEIKRVCPIPIAPVSWGW